MGGILLPNTASALTSSQTNITLRGANTSSTPAAGGLGHLVSGVGGPRQAKKALPGCTRRKLKKARAGASKAGSVGSQQPGNADLPKQGETTTRNFKRPRSPTETARAPKMPRDLQGGSDEYKGSFIQGNVF